MALNSLFTGLSGIQVHQTRTNVVADNIANINTTGFKGRRANFEELLAQTIKQATGPEGATSGTNPVQTGIGVRLKSIDTTFTQGTLQTTGRGEDLAVEGDGFFILSDGVSTFYTRDGAFTFDALGRLINPSNGLVVQGNIADSEGKFGATTGLESVQVDLSQEQPGVSTSRVNLSGNIDPGPVTTLGAATSYTTASTVDGPAALAFPFTLATEQQVEILANTSEGIISGIIDIPAATYTTIDGYVDALNAAIAGNERLSGQVLAQESTTTPNVPQIRSTFGGTDVEIALADVTVGSTATLGFGAAAAPAGTSAFNGVRTAIVGATTISAIVNGTTALTTDINDLSQVGTSLNSGDILRFSGTRSDGTTYNGSFTYTGAAGGQTLGDFLTSFAVAFGDSVTATLDPTGKVQLADSTGSAVTGFTASIALEDTGSSSGLIGEPGLSQHKISTLVFDSQGNTHEMNISLQESPVSNEWYYSVKVDNQVPDAGGSGSLIFDADGSIRSFVPSEGEGTLLQFSPDGSVLPLRVDLTGLSVPNRGINGLTQFAAPSTADVVDQNGRSAGRLDTTFIRPDGVIEGRFTNGETLELARVNLGNFDNAGGLQRIGGNLFTETENTGPANIEIATKTIETQIISGSLELSNVDLAQEFTDLIISQRGFQANARVVTTTDQILAETVNLKQ